MQSSFSFIIFALVATHVQLTATSSPPSHPDASIIPHGELKARATFNCTDLSADPSPRCWDDLSIPDYLAHWNRSTPVCHDATTTDEDGRDCCVPQEPWTTCFLRLAYGVAGEDCTSFDAQRCTLISSLSPGVLGSSDAPKVAYVVRNIVVINQLLNSYFQALQYQSNDVSGSGFVSARLNQILGGKAPISATLNNGNVVKAFLAGLPFWGVKRPTVIPSIKKIYTNWFIADVSEQNQTQSVLAGGPQQINPPVNSTAAQAFAQSLQNTEAISTLLFDTPYNSSDYTTTANDLDSDLNQVSILLERSLSLIMSDVPTFISWAAHGLYSGSTTATRIPPAGASAGITSVFTTYLVGETLAQFHFSATPVFPTAAVTRASFQQNRTCAANSDVCKDDDDGSSNGNGETYYRSPVSQMEYVINEPKNFKWGLPSSSSTSSSSSSGTQQQRTAIEQFGYEASAYGLLGYLSSMSDVYMPVLFDGAYNCTLEGKAGGATIILNGDGSLDVACLSSLPVYLAKGSSCPASAVLVGGGKCPFGFEG